MVNPVHKPSPSPTPTQPNTGFFSKIYRFFSSIFSKHTPNFTKAIPSKLLISIPSHLDAQTVKTQELGKNEMMNAVIRARGRDHIVNLKAKLGLPEKTMATDPQLLIALSQSSIKATPFQEAVVFMMFSDKHAETPALFESLKKIIDDVHIDSSIKSQVIKRFFKALTKSDQDGFLSSFSTPFKDPYLEAGRQKQLEFLENTFITRSSTLDEEKKFARLFHPETKAILRLIEEKTSPCSQPNFLKATQELKRYPKLEEALVSKLTKKEFLEIFHKLARSIDTLEHDPFTKSVLDAVYPSAKEAFTIEADHPLRASDFCFEDMIAILKKLPSDQSSFSKIFHMLSLDAQNSFIEELKKEPVLQEKFERSILERSSFTSDQRQLFEDKLLKAFHPEIYHDFHHFSELAPSAKLKLLGYFLSHPQYKSHQEALIHSIDKHQYHLMFQDLGLLARSQSLAPFFSQSLLNTLEKRFGFNYTETLCEKIYQASLGRFGITEKEAIMSLSDFDRYLVSVFIGKHAKDNPELALWSLSILTFEPHTEEYKEQIDVAKKVIKGFSRENSPSDLPSMIPQLEEDPRFITAQVLLGKEKKEKAVLASLKAISKVIHENDHTAMQHIDLETLRDPRVRDAYDAMRAHIKESQIKTILDAIKTQKARGNITTLFDIPSEYRADPRIIKATSIYITQLNQLFERLTNPQIISTYASRLPQVARQAALTLRQELVSDLSDIDGTIKKISSELDDLKAQQAKLQSNEGVMLEFQVPRFFDPYQNQLVTKDVFKGFIDLRIKQLDACVNLLKLISISKEHPDVCQDEVKALFDPERMGIYHLQDTHDPQYLLLSCAIYGYKFLENAREMIDLLPSSTQKVFIENLKKLMRIDPELALYLEATKVVSKKELFNACVYLKNHVTVINHELIDRLPPQLLNELKTYTLDHSHELDKGLIHQEFYLRGKLLDDSLFKACYHAKSLNKGLVALLKVDELMQLFDKIPKADKSSRDFVQEVLSAKRSLA